METGRPPGATAGQHPCPSRSATVIPDDHAPPGRPSRTLITLKSMALGHDGTVRVWDRVGGTPLTRPGRTVTSVAFGTRPDGRLVLASSHSNGEVRVWHLDRGAPLTFQTGIRFCLAFSATLGGCPLLICDSDEMIRLWDPFTGEPAGRPLLGHTDWVSAVASGVGTDGRPLIASGSWDGTVRIWDPAAHTPSATQGIGHASVVRSMAIGIGPSGRRLVAFADNDVLQLWDLATSTPVAAPLIGHTDDVISVAFGADDRGKWVLASASNDRTVRLWDPETGDCICKWPTGRTGALALGTGPQGQVLVATSINGPDTVQVWAPATGTPWGKSFTVQAADVASAAFGTDSDGRLILALGTNKGAIQVRDAAAGTRIGRRSMTHGGQDWDRVTSVAFGTDMDSRFLLASGGWDYTVRVWDPRTGAAVTRPLVGHTDRVTFRSLRRLPGRATAARILQ